MDLRQLRHFIALAEHANFTRAAEAACITQSAFSRSIQALEHDLGCRLVERGKRDIRLTTQGLALRARARELLAGASSLRTEIRELNRAMCPVLRFGAGPLPAARLIPDAMAGFLDSHGDIQVELCVDTPEVLRPSLDTGKIEFMVADLRHAEVGKGYVTRPLRARRFQLLCRQQHPLLRARSPVFAALADYPLVCASLPAELYALLGEHAGRRALPVNMECRNSDTLLRIIARSNSIGIATEDVVTHALGLGGLERLHFADTPQALLNVGTCFGIVYRADHQLSAAAQGLIERILRVDEFYRPRLVTVGHDYRVAV